MFVITVRLFNREHLCSKAVSLRTKKSGVKFVGYIVFESTIYFFVSFDADEEWVSFEWSPQFGVSIVEVIEDGVLDLKTEPIKLLMLVIYSFEKFLYLSSR